MKIKIKKGEYCTSRTLEINDKDVNDYSENELKEFVSLLSTQLNKDHLIEILDEIAYIKGDVTDSYSCDQCGDWNYVYEYECDVPRNNI